MKVELDLKLIKSFRLEEIPLSVDSKGKITNQPNPKLINGKPNPDFAPSYIVWDAHQSAPPGFGVRVAGKKTYVIRRKVNGKSIMPTVGNVADFPKIEDARKKAATLALSMLETGKNPNEEAKKIAASEFTLGMCFERYTNHLQTRAKKTAGPETLKVVRRVVKRFKEWGWDTKKVKDITHEEIKKKFEEGKDKLTANEQRFRWASAAVNWNIDREKFDAIGAGRKPGLTHNPFEILVIDQAYRSQEELDKQREAQSVRNPLQPSKSLGPFLEAAWSKRLTNDNETGVHFILLMLLLGCRKSEHAKWVWREFLDETSKADGTSVKNTSHVNLEGNEFYGPYVFFYKTKNGRNHRLPLGPMTVQLLKIRQESAAKESIERGFHRSRKFVFPAKNKASQSGHYVDATDLLSRIRDESGIERLTPHDMRRSFGTIMTSIAVPENIKRAFFNHANVSVTDTYTKAEWANLLEWMQRIEQAILATAPNIYNALKPVDWPPLPAPEPHVWNPPKPRTGRPKKAIVEQVRSI